MFMNFFLRQKECPSSEYKDQISKLQKVDFNVKSKPQKFFQYQKNFEIFSKR